MAWQRRSYENTVHAYLGICTLSIYVYDSCQLDSTQISFVVVFIDWLKPMNDIGMFCPWLPSNMTVLCRKHKKLTIQLWTNKQTLLIESILEV